MQEGNESLGKPKQNEKGCSGKIWDNLHIRFSYSTERKKCKNPYIPEGETEPNCHNCVASIFAENHMEVPCTLFSDSRDSTLVISPKKCGNPEKIEALEPESIIPVCTNCLNAVVRKKCCTIEKGNLFIRRTVKLGFKDFHAEIEFPFDIAQEFKEEIDLFVSKSSLFSVGFSYCQENRENRCKSELETENRRRCK